MGCARRSYRPRHAEASVLHGVTRDHVDDFYRQVLAEGEPAAIRENADVRGVYLRD